MFFTLYSLILLICSLRSRFKLANILFICNFSSVLLRQKYIKDFINVLFL